MKHLFLVALSIITIASYSQKPKIFELKSPDNKTTLIISAGEQIRWAAEQDGQPVISPSAISITLENEILGRNVKITSSREEKIARSFKAINYFKETVKDECNQLTLDFEGDWGLIFRAYNNAVAYRFFTKRKDSLIIQKEESNFNFPADEKLFAPIQWDYRDGKNFNSSFEALYHEIRCSQFPRDSLAFLPLLADAGGDRKVLITEADLEDYPGMYLNLNSTGQGLQGVWAPYPLKSRIFHINYVPYERANYIARVSGTRVFPWRVAVISRSDKELLNCDIVQVLASDPRMGDDYSWVKPGQAAWDWWNNWNISGVDFKAGINTKTYQYYIDFAAENKIPYIVMDEGWSDDLDLMKRIPDSVLNLQAVLDYAKQKNVGVFLWATWYAVSRQMDEVFPLYAKMGVKGFKIDFFDRDDQLVVASTYAIAKKAAENKLMVDYHGIYKPTGLQRTWPNVVSYEGVKGLENFKWANEDQPRYTASIPFIRMLAGPMDYTPGAMRNATAQDYRPVNGNPMSKGTRCEQLAEYVIFFTPFQMLSDNPTTYRREKESLDFITRIPTTFDETVPLESKVGEWAALARRKGGSWWVGALGDLQPKDIVIDLSFLPAGEYNGEFFYDGVNADRKGTDYRRETVTVRSGEKLKVHLAPGGGFAGRISPTAASMLQNRIDDFVIIAVSDLEPITVNR